MLRDEIPAHRRKNVLQNFHLEEWLYPGSGRGEYMFGASDPIDLPVEEGEESEGDDGGEEEEDRRWGWGDPPSGDAEPEPWGT